MRKFAENYKGVIHPFIQRLIILWSVLRYRNIILIAGIAEFERDGEKGRRVKTIRRTDYDSDSDYLSCICAAYQVNPEMFDESCKQV